MARNEILSFFCSAKQTEFRKKWIEISVYFVIRRITFSMKMATLVKDERERGRLKKTTVMKLVQLQRPDRNKKNIIKMPVFLYFRFTKHCLIAWLIILSWDSFYFLLLSIDIVCVKFGFLRRYRTTSCPKTAQPMRLIICSTVCTKCIAGHQ
jgi:hypothetical protein